MAYRFFYAWQSERPSSVCRYFIRNVLEELSTALSESGVDERIEIDSDTQGIPGVPEILSTILRKIDEDDIFVADLTMCCGSFEKDISRLSPNPNVMFEYGGRERIICVMNAFYGGSDPSDLPFDLRHARAPIRYRLGPNATVQEKDRERIELRDQVRAAAQLILDNLPSSKVDLPRVEFQRPHFTEGQQLTPEGDFPGRNDPTYFTTHDGFVYLKGRPSTIFNLSVSEIKRIEEPTAGLMISSGSSTGSFGSNKWGRISYTLKGSTDTRLSSDYVQYFRSGEIEIVNGSYLTILKRNGGNVIHADYLVTQIITPMLRVAQRWLEKLGSNHLIVEVGIVGVERWRLTLNNFGTGPMIHVDRVSVQKAVDKESILLLDQEFRSELLSEAGLS